MIKYLDASNIITLSGLLKNKSLKNFKKKKWCVCVWGGVSQMLPLSMLYNTQRKKRRIALSNTKGDIRN
jgi:hypothetical protein